MIVQKLLGLSENSLLNRGRSILNKNLVVSYATNDRDQTPQGTPKTGGYAKAFAKFENLKDNVPQLPSQTFASLLRNSKFIDLGDPEGKIVVGRLFHVINDDLYIDFGWKFHCVCLRPKKDASKYVRGVKVRLRINSLELSSNFLGYEKDLTLLEADCTLLGLVQEQNKIVSE